ncbi:ATP-binding protein [Chthonobacter albigriseus]|uniref:ATP-binding protein n=1 Tax=Chthonobacter albigriseus TaxID=1683161 RepID=UPI0015EE9AB9|nr:ATP-binding protein [Chthonobacter albigriseus]
MSLRGRLIGAIAVVLAAALLIGSVFSYGHAQRKVLLEMDAAMDVARNTIARAIREAPQPIQRATLVVALRVFDGDRHVRAELLGPGGKVEMVSALRTPAGEVPDWFVRLVAPDFSGHEVVITPVVQGGWSIRLVPDPRSEVDEVWTDMLLNLSVLSVFCVAAFVFVSAIISRALAPIASLSSAFRAIGEGNYAVRIAEHGTPELKRLCAGCNDMAGRLEGMAARNRQLSDQLIRLQDEERADLARDLHDEVGPFLFAIDVDAAALAGMAESRGPLPAARVGERAEAIRQAAAHARKYVRSILGHLRPGVAGSLGLCAAIQELANFHAERHPSVVFELDLPDRGFGNALDSVILAVVREAVNNAVRHGRPGRVEVSIVPMDNEVAFSVKDDGDGLPANVQAGGYGLINMRERVESVGGTITVANRAYGKGVAVSAVIPLAEADSSLNGGEEVKEVA